MPQKDGTFRTPGYVGDVADVYLVELGYLRFVPNYRTAVTANIYDTILISSREPSKFREIFFREGWATL